MEVANYHLLFMTIFLVYEYNCYPDLIEVIKLKATLLTEVLICFYKLLNFKFT